jgi:PBP1b-binding outer membrane lipoprotein LpoB
MQLRISSVFWALTLIVVLMGCSPSTDSKMKSEGKQEQERVDMPIEGPSGGEMDDNPK